ncbi:MAG: hypothetical protein M1368_10920, partial [Thaumarchaeota archaeon]|nr:hypothetical protein [Nitrososphaerota archaeon]
FEYNKITLSSLDEIFVLIMFRQLSQNIPLFDWNQKGFDLFGLFLMHFGLSIALGVTILTGGFGIFISLHNIKERAADNARLVRVKEATNRSGEAISYIGTYILPFVFEDYKDWFGTIAMVFLLLVIYRIYINSSLLLINPLLNMRYALYDVTFADGEETRSGMLITKDQQLDDGDEARIYNLGKKLFYGVNP